MAFVRFEARVEDPGDARMRFQVARDPQGAVILLPDAQVERLQERGLGGEELPLSKRKRASRHSGRLELQPQSVRAGPYGPAFLYGSATSGWKRSWSI